MHILTIAEYILRSPWLFCGPAEPSRCACRRFVHWNTYWSKSHYTRFINRCSLAGCLSAPLPASARLGAGACLLWDSDVGRSFAWLAAILISGLLARSTSHGRQCIVSSELGNALCAANARLKDLGFKLGRWLWAVIGMSRKWLQNIEAILQSSDIKSES